MTPRLKELYLKEIQTSLKNQFGLKNLSNLKLIDTKIKRKKVEAKK